MYAVHRARNREIDQQTAQKMSILNLDDIKCLIFILYLVVNALKLNILKLYKIVVIIYRQMYAEYLDIIAYMIEQNL